MKKIIILTILLIIPTWLSASYLAWPDANNFQPILFYDFGSHKEYPLRFWYDDLDLENNRENYQVDGNDIGLRTGNQFENVYCFTTLDKDKHGDPFWVIQYHYYYARNCSDQWVLGYFQTHEHDWEWTYVTIIEDDQGFTPFLATGSGHDDDNHDAYTNGDYGWFYSYYMNWFDSLQIKRSKWSGLSRNADHVMWRIANTGNEFKPDISGGSIPMPYNMEYTDGLGMPNIYYFGDPANNPVGGNGTGEYDNPREAPWARPNHWSDPFPDGIDVPDCIPPVVLSVEITQNGKTCYWGRWTETPKFMNGVRLVESRKWEEMPANEKDSVLLGQKFKVRITFSEKMKGYNKPISVKFAKNSPFEDNEVTGDWIADNIWEGEYIYPSGYSPDDYRGDNTLCIYAEDKEGNMLDGRPETVVSVNASGRNDYEDEDGQNGYGGKDVLHIFSIGGSKFQVCNTDPTNGEEDVPVCGEGKKTASGAEIKITFTQEVDTTTFDHSKVRFMPALFGDFTHGWSSNCDEVIITLTDVENDLSYYTKYEITLSDSIRDTSNVRLDGDGDGFPGGDYTFEFTTRAPQIAFSGGVEMFGPRPQSKVVRGTVTNLESRPVQLAFSDTSGSLSGSDGDWSYQVAMPQLTLAAGETKELGLVQLTHNASGASAYGVPIDAFASPAAKGRAPGGVRADFMGASTDSGGNNNNGGGGLGNGPGGDQGLILPGPDDNWSLSDPIYPTPWLVDTKSDVGLVMSGYCSAAGHLLGKYGIKTSLVSARDLKVISNDIKDIDGIEVLIVASGGLRGKEFDQEFWQKLEQYVWNGGYLIVLDQPFGQLYSRLPGSPQARGWEEDLSCTGWFTKLEGWHPAMAGQNTRMNNYPTDGYFTWLPFESQVIARRQLRGGSPSTILYPWGEGRVVATACYTDWGYGAGQWNNRSNHLLRDLVNCTIK